MRQKKKKEVDHELYQYLRLSFDRSRLITCMGIAIIIIERTDSLATTIYYVPMKTLNSLPYHDSIGRQQEASGNIENDKKIVVE